MAKLLVNEDGVKPLLTDGKVVEDNGSGNDCCCGGGYPIIYCQCENDSAENRRTGYYATTPNEAYCTPNGPAYSVSGQAEMEVLEGEVEADPLPPGWSLETDTGFAICNAYDGFRSVTASITGVGLIDSFAVEYGVADPPDFVYPWDREVPTLGFGGAPVR